MDYLKNINTIYLLLGSNCNFRCKYCVQQFENRKPFNCHSINNKLIKYIKDIASIRKSVNKDLCLMFWGGEPLVYFNTIKELVSLLKDVDNITFTTVTNGSLLNDEIVDFINENNIHIAISHDGLNTKFTRNRDILLENNKLEVIRKINNLSFNSVISAKNDDFLRTIYYIYDKIGYPVKINFEWLMCSEDTIPELYQFDYDNFYNKTEEYFNKLRYSILNGTDLEMIFSEYQRFNSIFNYNEEKFPKCGQIKKVLNLDLQGNQYACHPADIIGDINTDYSELLKIYNEKYNIKFDNPTCLKCKYLYLCKAGCPLESDNVGRIAVCKAKKIYYKQLIDFVNSFGKDS